MIKRTLHLLCENYLDCSNCLEVFVLSCGMKAAVMGLICEGSVTWKMGQKFVNCSYRVIRRGNAVSFVCIYL